MEFAEELRQKNEEFKRFMEESARSRAALKASFEEEMKKSDDSYKQTKGNINQGFKNVAKMLAEQLSDKKPNSKNSGEKDKPSNFGKIHNAPQFDKLKEPKLKSIKEVEPIKEDED